MTTLLEHKQVIVLRKDLNMRKGKLVAQGAHASMGAILGLCKQDGDKLVLQMDDRVRPKRSACMSTAKLNCWPYTNKHRNAAW
jgi:peptidyl-tRNA hydrolase